MSAALGVLYVTYDGVMEPLGQSQILPYLTRLSAGRAMTLVSFEKPDDYNDLNRRRCFVRDLEAAGIRWVPLRYHKRPRVVSTAWDLTRGFVVCAWLRLTSNIKVVHARSFVAAALAWPLKRLFGGFFIFDTRGFWVDGRVANGSMPEGSVLLRVARWFEYRFLHDADVIFVLSQAALDLMKQHPALLGRHVRLESVTTCTDLARFRPPADRSQRGSRALTLGYVGNAGPGYLLDPVIDLFKAIRTIRPDARLKIVNRNDHDRIANLLSEREVDGACVELLACDYPDVPGHMSDMDIGLLPIFHPRVGGGRRRSTDDDIAEGPAALGNVPTRLGEFLACGVPCVATGHSDGGVDVLEREGVGLVLRRRDPQSMAEAAVKALALVNADRISQRCVDVARRYFSLDSGVAVYDAVYRSLDSGSALPVGA